MSYMSLFNAEHPETKNIVLIESHVSSMVGISDVRNEFAHENIEVLDWEIEPPELGYMESYYAFRISEEDCLLFRLKFGGGPIKDTEFVILEEQDF